VNRLLERNLRLIPLHQALTRAHFWLPVFVLFTRARFDLDGAILLASLYYLFVVVLEVPSGWMSDRLGRVLTLRLASIVWVGAQACFLLGDDRFAVIVLGQALLATGFASLSGTDVTFHYDTLEALGRSGSYEDRQGKVAALGLVSSSIAALIGGLLGLIDVRWAFGAALLAALVQLSVTLQLTEPPHDDLDADPFARQISLCVRYLRHPSLAWLFGYGIALVTLEHVAFTLMQPWLTEALDKTPDELGATPSLSGGVFALTAAVGALSARLSAPLSRRFGVRQALIGFAVVSALVVTAMAASFHVAVIAVIAFRGAQTAAAPVIISAAAAPELARGHRATFLSLNSLAGRLGYGCLLLIVSTYAESDVRAVLIGMSILSWFLVAVLAISGALVPSERFESSGDRAG
jgi:MFS family permease